MTGDQLAAWRNYYQLTQGQLARLLGVHQVTVAKWEVGMRTIPPFLGLALETIQRELPRSHRKMIRKANPRSVA